MTTANAVDVVRIEVGKSNLDSHILDSGVEPRFDNSRTGHRTLCNWLFLHPVDHAVFEPTGRYHRNLHQSVFGVGIQAVLVNPLRSSRIVNATGQLAKIDRLDAAMLARYGLLDRV